MAQSQKVHCAAIQKNTTPILAYWKQGEMDHLMQRFGKKVGKKFEKVMSYIDSSRKF